MPPSRIQHESHTCSEQSLRILTWNASYVQKNNLIIPDRDGFVTRPEKLRKVLQWQMKIADCDNSAVEEPSSGKNRRAGSWLGRLPLTKMKLGAGTQIGVPICITRSNGCLRW